MSIKLSWVNKNTQPVTTTIYRSDTKIDRANLPAPLVVLTAQETSYVDLTAVQGNTYHYVFKTTNGSETIISRDQPIQAAETRGPGSNVFIYGDRELGLYDILSVDSFITAANLNTLVGSAVANVYANTSWYKYARRGKVYMVPEHALGNSTGYNALQLKGLIDGTVVQIAGYNWKVRLMRGWNESDSAVPLPAKALGTFDTTAYTQTCEFNDFVYPMCAPTPLTQRMPNWLQVAVTNLYSTGYYILCQEKGLEGDMAFVRYFAGITTNERTKLSSAGFQGLASTTTTFSWWPVLELVEA
ncbi:hypothetical protein pEaSNUABM37_00131 [Erwinia phage pEa_SNUABM_37]|nr:hypothetical protein pEaSNUABM37_00131 [Erwinia phage pEa_SNUABM_37]QXO10601.1 hypothetical protein pEaSNUABM48_00131 [Erwinia phage pEa_SNUABM_48]